MIKQTMHNLTSQGQSSPYRLNPTAAAGASPRSDVSHRPHRAPHSRRPVAGLAAPLLFLLAALLLAGCRSQEPRELTLPTRTPRPTFTPTPVQPSAQPQAAQPGQSASLPQAAGQAAPPAAEVPPPTESLVAVAVVNSPVINTRLGPGTDYPLAQQVQRGAELQILARNPAGDWLYVCCVAGQEVWIAGWLVDTLGPADAVPVAAIPTLPPTVTAAPAPPRPPPATPAPQPPTATPTPPFSFIKGEFVEPRVNTNPVITFFGLLCGNPCPGAGVVAEGYKLVVEGPGGRREVAFDPFKQDGDPGLDSEFIYNAKLELAGAAAGSYRVYVADAGGNPASEAWEYQAQGAVRTYLPRFVRR